MPINKQLVIEDLTGVFRSKEGAKMFPAKTKLEDACQLRREVQTGRLKQWSRSGVRTMARPNSPDMPPKRTKKVRLGIIIIIVIVIVIVIIIIIIIITITIIISISISIIIIII